MNSGCGTGYLFPLDVTTANGRKPFPSRARMCSTFMIKVSPRSRKVSRTAKGRRCRSWRDWMSGRTTTSTFERERGANERRDQRRKPIFERRALGLKERGYEEWVSLQFHGANFTRGIFCGCPQRTGEESCAKRGIQAVPAAIHFGCFEDAISRRDARAWAKADRIRGLDQGAGKQRDNGARRLRKRCGVLRICPTQNGAGVLQNGVLKSAASAQERPSLLARPTDGAQGAA